MRPLSGSASGHGNNAAMRQISRLFARGDSGRHQPLDWRSTSVAASHAVGRAGAGHKFAAGQDLSFLSQFSPRFGTPGGAERRYEHLRRAGAAALPRETIVPGDIPRRPSKEFYSSIIGNGEKHGALNERVQEKRAATTQQR